MISRVTKLSGSKLILYPKFQHKTKKTTIFTAIKKQWLAADNRR